MRRRNLVGKDNGIPEQMEIVYNPSTSQNALAYTFPPIIYHNTPQQMEIVTIQQKTTPSLTYIEQKPQYALKYTGPPIIEQNALQ